MSLRKQLIRLAHQEHSLRKHLVPVLRKTAETFEESVEGKTFRNPESGNQVQFKSLPPKEQEKLRAQWEGKQKEKKEPEPKEKEPVGFKEKLTSFLSKARKDIAAEVKKASEEVHKIVTNVEHREKALASIAKKIKASPKTFVDKTLKGMQDEVHEFAHAVKASRKLFKKPPPGPFTKEDKKALYGASAYVVGALLAAIPPGSALMAATITGNSFANHVGMKMAHSMLDQGFLHYEWAETLMEGYHKLHAVLASEDGDDAAFLEALTRVAADTLSKGISDTEMEKILKGVELPKE